MSNRFVKFLLKNKENYDAGIWATVFCVFELFIWYVSQYWVGLHRQSTLINFGRTIQIFQKGNKKNNRLSLINKKIGTIQTGIFRSKNRQDTLVKSIRSSCRLSLRSAKRALPFCQSLGSILGQNDPGGLETSCGIGENWTDRNRSNVEMTDGMCWPRS